MHGEGGRYRGAGHADDELTVSCTRLWRDGEDHRIGYLVGIAGKAQRYVAGNADDGKPGRTSGFVAEANETTHGAPVREERAGGAAGQDDGARARGIAHQEVATRDDRNAECPERVRIGGVVGSPDLGACGVARGRRLND